MRWRGMLKASLLTWLVVELCALVVAVRFLGWPSTLAVGIATTAAGFLVLREAGRHSLTTLKSALNGAPNVGLEVSGPGVLRLASGVLLLLPGFISDLVGLLLLAPFVRERLANRFFKGAKRAAKAEGVLDLDPAEWRAGRSQESSASCEPLTGMLPGGPKDAHSRRRDDE